MAKTIPFPQHIQAARARRHRAKGDLLPMPRASSDELALQVHLSLAALHAGGSQHDAQAILHAHWLAQACAEAGYGVLAPELIGPADEAILACFSRGGAQGEWRLDDAQFDAIKAVIAVYDQQLQSAPLWVLTEASERLERVRAGDTRQAARRRA